MIQALLDAISVADDQDWRAMALCAQGDPNLWFSPGALEHKVAKRVCKLCPVRAECLTYAMEQPIDHGIWGGLTERERGRARRKAPAGDWRSAMGSPPDSIRL